MILVPRERLDELENGFLDLRFMANRIATELRQGAAPEALARLLRKEVERALTTITQWREARWQVEHSADRQP